MLSTPKEILDFYPHIKKVWTCNDLGYLLHLKLVSGRKMTRGCVVEVKDVLEVFKQVKKK